MLPLETSLVVPKTRFVQIENQQTFQVKSSQDKTTTVTKPKPSQRRSHECVVFTQTKHDSWTNVSRNLLEHLSVPESRLILMSLLYSTLARMTVAN